MILGGALLVSGVLILLLSRMGNIDHLPGTINIELGNGRMSFPILTSIILSIVLTIVVNLVLRLFNR